MSDLPTGTVSLLFSDIEGSTALLSRLGPAYADALDGQRQVLRRAWAEHAGTELGTEGDSFFVVFITAEDAVAAAAAAQLELAGFDWPGGDQVRVRMGIHTGTPTVHDGGYVGMDVHRAARIAGSAHGGQVVLSEPTAKLVEGRLPERVDLRDLGSHQLKDIAHPERLFQLTIHGLRNDFAPIKTLGAASSLPRPATPLVGRDSELAELAALLGSPDVRLVTLTGPGGSGKTRLGIEVARRLVERFPDGVYFVPLATVTTADVMWSSIAEALGVPPEARMPPGLFAHIAHRSALLVLDNLEQISAADDVVAQLLESAPDVVAIATSRRRLRIPGEYDHGVPPLELPQSDDLEGMKEFGAIRMFVEHARMAKSTFRLTAENAADVVQLCRRLDGLPLAIELAAARANLLSPAALLARLDKALDIASGGTRGPSRQQTLRDTIAWSYALLSGPQQAFFRRLAVFAGGADLDAISALTTNDLDPLDLVADLVDASLIISTDGVAGEPRFDMLETIRAYAYDELRSNGELHELRRNHAEYFLAVAQGLRPLLSGRGDQRIEARSRFELELDNVREALSWTLGADSNGASSAGDAKLGLQLCAELTLLWEDSGYFAEERQWLERAINTDVEESKELGLCQVRLARLLILQGDVRRAYVAATHSVRTWRRLDDKAGLSGALAQLGRCEQLRGNMGAAREAFEESVLLAQQSEETFALTRALGNLALLEHDQHNFERSLELMDTAVELLLTLGDDLGVLQARHNMACTLRQMGRLEDAHQEMRQQIPDALQFGDAEMIMVLAEDYAALLAQLGSQRRATRLLGAVDAMRERSGALRDPAQEQEVSEPFRAVRASLGDQAWKREYEAGTKHAVEEALVEAHMALHPALGRQPNASPPAPY